MFGLGPTELIVILVLALVLLGPKKLPDVASGLGKAIRQFRKATRDLTDQLDIDDEVKQPFRELKAALRDEPAPYVPPAIVAPANAVKKETAAEKPVADKQDQAEGPEMAKSLIEPQSGEPKPGASEGDPPDGSQVPVGLNPPKA